jgi:hypothetical protein
MLELGLQAHRPFAGFPERQPDGGIIRRTPFFMDSCIPSSKAAACPSSVSHWASISVPGEHSLFNFEKYGLDVLASFQRRSLLGEHSRPNPRAGTR